MCTDLTLGRRYVFTLITVEAYPIVLVLDVLSQSGQRHAGKVAHVAWITDIVVHRGDVMLQRPGLGIQGCLVKTGPKKHSKWKGSDNQPAGILCYACFDPNVGDLVIFRNFLLLRVFLRQKKSSKIIQA